MTGKHGGDGTVSARCGPARVRRVPRLADPLVDRPRLLDRLDAGRPLTVLRAPSGFGKTTLAAQWVRTRTRPAGITAWLRAPATADPAAFWTALADTLAAAGLPGARHRRPDEARATVEQTLDAAEAPVLLIVDQLDNLTDPRLDEQLLDLLRQSPTLTLVISLRSHRRLPAHQLLDVDATVVPACELLLTPDEGAALAEAIVPGLPAEIVDAVHLDCGGWPTLTRAVLLAVAERPAAPSAHETATIVDGICADYVWGRLLPDTTPADRVEFALRTALADELTVNAAELLGAAGSGKAYLDRLVADGLLSVESRPGAQVYLWPAAARRVLSAELRRRHARRLPRLHGVLARGFADEDRHGSAIHHAVRAGDWPLVVTLVDSSWRSLLAQHRDRLYDAVVAAPLRLIRTSPRATAMRDVVLQLPAEQMLSTDMLPRSTDELDALGRSEDAAQTLDTAFAVLIALVNCGPLEPARDFALRVLRLARTARAAHPTQVAALYPHVLAQVGVALICADDPGAAIEPLREAYRHAADRRFDYLARETASQLVLVKAVLGEIRQADAWLSHYNATAPPSSRPPVLIEPVADTARLLVALDRLDLAEAAARAARLIRPVHTDRSWGLTAYAQALLALHDGTAADTLEQLRRAAAACLEWPAPGTIGEPLLAAAEADLLLCLGRGQQASAVLHGEHAEHRALRVGQARLALLTGDPTAALRLATDQQWEQRATTRHRREMLLIRAVAAHRAGDRDTALDSLRRAAHATRATGAVRPFATVPRRDLDELAAHVPLTRELLACPALAGHPGLFPDQVALLTLTRREQLVLEKLAAGLNLQQTADALVVSYNTIRSQQASIYRKLGVDSRPAAIARARESGLL